MGSDSKPAYPRDIKMQSLTDVGRMMNKLFRETRRGSMTTQDMGRYFSALNILAGVFKSEKELDHEERMQAIERVLEDRNYDH